MRILPFLLSLLCLTAPTMAIAQLPVSGEVLPESQFIFNSLLFLMCGFMVMFMAAGFTCLEAGMVRSTSVSTICVKNIALYSVAGLMFYFGGYQLMYSGVDGGWMGEFGSWGADYSEHLDASGSYIGGAESYAASSDWFFQMVFVATAASIVSGTVAERVKLWSFLLFCAILTGFIYPITGAWTWGQGWLNQMGFLDFAGSTIVHSVGGWAALVGVLLIGARKGRYGPHGKPNPMPGSNLPLATLGTWILWMGWFGFNGGSQLKMGSAMDVSAVADIFVNTNMAAAAGTITAMVFTQLIFRKVDLTMTLNGALAGLVSITAEPFTPSIGEAMLIGAIGSILMCLCVPLLDRLKIDDVVGAIPVHLVCGIWGTFAVPITNPEANFVTQLVGIGAVGGFVIIASLIAWGLISMLMGIRISEEMEEMGIDQAEVGLDAYPEFVRSHKY